MSSHGIKVVLAILAVTFVLVDITVCEYGIIQFSHVNPVAERKAPMKAARKRNVVDAPTETFNEDDIGDQTGPCQVSIFIQV